MSTSLWTALDGAIANAIDLALGPEGTYTDLVLRRVEVTDKWQPATWPKPGAIVVSVDAKIRTEGHGAGRQQIAITYSYMIVLFAEATSHAGARQAAQTLHARALSVLQGMPTIFAAAHQSADAGEYARSARVAASTIQAIGQDGAPAQAGKYLGVASIRVDIEAIRN